MLVCKEETFGPVAPLIRYNIKLLIFDDFDNEENDLYPDLKIFLDPHIKLITVTF